MTADHDDLRAQSPGIARQVARDLLLVAHHRVKGAMDRGVVQHDQDEFDVRVGGADLPFKPFPLFAPRFQWRIGIQNHCQQSGADAHRVPAVRAQRQGAECCPPVLETGSRVAVASIELVIPERGKHRDLPPGPLYRLALVRVIVLWIAAFVNQVPAYQDRRRVFARDPADERAPRGGAADVIAPAEARVAVDDENQRSSRPRRRHLESRRLIAACRAQSQPHAQERQCRPVHRLTLGTVVPTRNNYRAFPGKSTAGTSCHPG